MLRVLLDAQQNICSIIKIPSMLRSAGIYSSVVLLGDTACCLKKIKVEELKGGNHESNIM